MFLQNLITSISCGKGSDITTNDEKKILKVIHYHRKPEIDYYSIERLFVDIRAAMPSDIDVVIRESSFLSRGLWRRVFNIIEATFHQGDVNHITGDVHFLTYLLKHKQTVLTIHDCVSLERLHGIKRWVLWLFWYWLPVRCSAAITVNSKTTKRELLRFISYNPDKIHVIYSCISEWFRPYEREFNSSCPRILQIGTKPNKNIERVAAALAGIESRWVVIGHLSQDQCSLIESYGIHYENYFGLNEDALLEQYQLADMLVFASTYEGFGAPIAEMNAVGRPVITSELYSMPEVAGDAACLVDPYDVQSIRTGILRVIEDAGYRDCLVKAGFCNRERFRPAVIAEQYASLYRNLAGAE